jgi:RNA polymerase sigma-70 factor (ECF subfamily)
MTGESRSHGKGFTEIASPRSRKVLAGFPAAVPGSPRPRPGLSRREERSLVAAARRGDAAARTRLVEALSGTVFRFGRAFCRDPDDAEDVLQDVLLKLLEALPSFRGESALSTWAFTVARRTCALRRRREARFASLEGRAGEPARALPDPGASPSRDAERGELRASLERGLARLPAAQREVLLLRDVEGRSAAEVARALEIGERAVKSRLHRARRALRESLAPLDTTAASRGCPDIEGLASRALEGELDASICRRLAAHVERCPRCAATCHALRSVLGRCRAWGEARPSQAVARATRSVLRRAAVGETTVRTT